jgi:hypothetical protein
MIEHHFSDAAAGLLLPTPLLCSKLGCQFIIVIGQDDDT